MTQVVVPIIRQLPSIHRLVQLLLKASREQSALQVFVNEFVEVFSLNACHLMIVNDSNNAILYHVSAGNPVKEEYVLSYQNKYMPLDLIVNHIKTTCDSEFFVTNLWEKKEAYYRSRYFQEWARPQGLTDGGAACILKEQDWRCIMVHNRCAEHGLYSETERQGMNQLVPYIETAIRSYYQREILCHDYAQTLIEGYRSPVAILNEFGAIWRSNQLMLSMLNDESTLYVRDGILRAHATDVDHDMITTIMSTASTLLPDQHRFVQVDENTRLHFSSISEESANMGIKKGVFVFVLSARYRKHVSQQHIMDIFSLTPAEALVCAYLLDGKELKEIAKIRNKSINTIREQLYESFRKIGCNSQTELVNTLTSIPIV